MSRRIAHLAIAALLLMLPVAGHADPATQSITLASTTSGDNSGLLAAILPAFTRATGIAVRLLALGTGQALDTARRGDADLVLCMIPRPNKNLSTMATASTAGKLHGTISLSSARNPIRRMSSAHMTLLPLSRRSRRHGAGAQRRCGDAGLHAFRSRHLAELSKQADARCRRPGRRSSDQSIQRH